MLDDRFPELTHDELLEDAIRFQQRRIHRQKQTFAEGRKRFFPEEDKLIILTDIVGFSKSTTEEQVEAIYLFQHYIRKMKFISTHLSRRAFRVDAFIPTGDGCYIIADACPPEIAVEFLTSLISGFQLVQKVGGEQHILSLRASALLGTCVPFLDLAMHRNYIGDGMNEAARILSGGQQALEARLMEEGVSKEQAKVLSRNSLYVGDSLRDALEKCQLLHETEQKPVLHYFEDVADKHGKTRNITVLQGISSIRIDALKDIVIEHFKN